MNTKCVTIHAFPRKAMPYSHVTDFSNWQVEVQCTEMLTLTFLVQSSCFTSAVVYSASDPASITSTFKIFIGKTFNT